MIEFTDMKDVLKSVSGPRFAIQKFTMTKGDVDMAKFRGALNGIRGYAETRDLKPGTYIKLIDKAEAKIVMSDTPMERRTNQDFLDAAHGHVLIGGLGIGMILAPLLKKEGVLSVAVAEKHQEVIDLFWSAGFPRHPRLNVFCADVMKWEPTGIYNTIYFDIWPSIGGDNWPDMKLLKKKYRKCLNKSDRLSSIACWREKDMARCAREDRKFARESKPWENAIGGKIDCSLLRDKI